MTGYTRPWSLPEPEATTIHHVSDLHVGYRPWSFAECDHMREDIVTEGLIPEVDAFVLTGDITDDAIPTEEAYAIDWMTDVGKSKPALWVPGNHDLRDPVGTRAKWEAHYGRSGNDMVDLVDHRLVSFTADKNTWKKPGDPDSHWDITAATWEWMDEMCTGSIHPVVLCCHYPPWELEPDDDWCIQDKVTMAQFISDHPNVVGMLVGHMHWEISNPKSNALVSIGNRTNFPVIMGVSAMLSISGLAQDQSARLPSISKYVTLYEDRWEVRCRLHGPHAWGGPSGYRVSTIHLDTGLVDQGM